MKYIIKEIEVNSFNKKYDYTLTDQDGKKLMSGDFYSLSFVSDIVVYYEKRLYGSRKLDYFEVGFMNLQLNKVIYSEFNTVYNDNSCYSGFGITHENYNEGLLKISKGKNKTFFIDETGIIKFEVSSDYKNIGTFSDGLVSCQDNYTDYYIFDYQSHKIELLNSIVVDYLKPRFNKKNQTIINSKTDEDLIPFKQVNIGNNISYDKWFLWGYKNTKDEIIIKPQFLKANAFDNGIAIVQGCIEETPFSINQDSKKYGCIRRYGYINNKGDYIIKPKYTTAHNFFQGIAVVVYLDGSNYIIGLINKKGETICNLQFHEIINIGIERFLIFTKRKIGFLNKEGKWQIKPRFESVCSFENGKCYVMKNGLWGQIDKNGKWLFKPTFNNLRDCIDYFKKINITYE